MVGDGMQGQLMNPKETARKLLGMPPNPGSDEAIEQGCFCPILDNYHGRGVAIDGEWQFWINEDCPLHGRKHEETTYSK